MNQDFTHTAFGDSDVPVCRLGLSASYWPGQRAIHTALDEGLNFFFLYGFDRQMVRVLRDVLPGRRDRCVVATGAYNLIWGHPNVRRTLEKRLRQLRTDYIDVFLLLGVMKEKQFTERAQEDLRQLRDEGKVRWIGVSTHDRKFAGRLMGEGIFNAIMMRYNAAHRGAEQDIFPHLERHNPGVISYTATRWSYLARRPRSWPKDKRIPTAGMCYRFVLSNPHVDVCLTAPSQVRQLTENIAALRDGPLDADEMEFMRTFGDVVHHTKRWFM
jgi:aryl-alcohol dehydrogenase-like predicted oxidoreductase